MPLLISVTSAPQWLATAVRCPVMIISGNFDPHTLMPDYASDMSDQPAAVQSIVEGASLVKIYIILILEDCVVDKAFSPKLSELITLPMQTSKASKVAGLTMYVSRSQQ